jgi:glycosyltransferase involved in cell wall biosynthesis
MPAPYRDRVWDLLSRHARRLHALVSVSRFYADSMAARLGVDRSRVAVVRAGLSLDGYEPAGPPSPPAIGYLSRMSETLGLGSLAEAFLQLRARPGLDALRLKVAGGHTADDVTFLDGLRRKLTAAGAWASVEFHSNLGRTERQSFLRGLSVLSVPSSSGGAFGMFLVEAMACGVPVVQPRSGAFTELVEMTGGGLLYEPGDATALAHSLETLLRDPARAAALGRQGRAAVREQFTSARMAQDLVRVLQG